MREMTRRHWPLEYDGVWGRFLETLFELFHKDLDALHGRDALPAPILGQWPSAGVVLLLMTALLVVGRFV